VLEAVVGHRPTWPLGKRAAADRQAPPAGSYWSYQFEDGFAVFEEAAEPAAKPRAPKLTKGQLDALAVLGLEEPVTLLQLKARYKELVKRYHPDANGGNRDTEERLKQVIKAYGHLRATGYPRAA
jgi:DnaJ-domain-containing protein 1